MAAMFAAACAAPMPEGAGGGAPTDLTVPAAPLAADEDVAPEPDPHVDPPTPAAAPDLASGGGAVAGDAPASASDRGAGGDGAGPPRPPSPRTEAPSPEASAGFVVVARLDDRQGDHGLAGITAPAYADLVAVTLEDDGTTARLTVEVAGTIPATLADGEVMGIAVDLFADAAASESDRQVFADGGRQGWFASLHTPDGPVRYPGTFQVGRTRLVFELPWAALGGRPVGEWRAFVDWSKRQLGPNPTSHDRAPDRGRAPFVR